MFNTHPALLEVTLLPKGMNSNQQSVGIKTDGRAESSQREGKDAFLSNYLSVEVSDLLASQKINCVVPNHIA